MLVGGHVIAPVFLGLAPFRGIKPPSFHRIFLLFRLYNIINFHLKYMGIAPPFIQLI
jgi:hypothetical protein